MLSSFMFIILWVVFPNNCALAQNCLTRVTPPGIWRFPPIRIEVSPKSKAYIPAGTEGQIVLLLKNDQIKDTFYITAEDDKNFFLGFERSTILLECGQTKEISGTIRVPPDAHKIVSILTVTVRRKTDSVISERRVIIRTKFKPDDEWAPTCSIESVSQCDENLDESVCSSQHWLFRVQIQDINSGLRSVTVKPDGRFHGENFPVNTNGSVYIEKIVSCCTSSVELTAVDVKGNEITCRPDWYTSYLITSIRIALVVIVEIVLNIALIAMICRYLY